MFVAAAHAILVVFLPSPLHQGFMTIHTKDSLRCPCILQIFNLLFAIPTLEASRAESLVTRQDGQILDFIPAYATTVGTVVAYQRPIAVLYILLCI